jgi:DNA-binding transcriptional ArsR family regulator
MAGIRARRSRESIDTEEVFGTLSNQRRRFVVHALGQEGSMEIGELARRVAGWEYRKNPETVTSAERRRVYNSLQQVHLPKMDDRGLVEYDSQSGKVRATGELSDLGLYLEVVPADDISWSTYYLLLGVFGVLFATVTASGLPVFGAVPDVVGALTTGVLLVCSAAVHTYATRGCRLGVEGPPPELDEE